MIAAQPRTSSANELSPAVRRARPTTAGHACPWRRTMAATTTPARAGASAQTMPDRLQPPGPYAVQAIPRNGRYRTRDGDYAHHQKRGPRPRSPREVTSVFKSGPVMPFTMPVQPRRGDAERHFALGRRASLAWELFGPFVLDEPPGSLLVSLPEAFRVGIELAAAIPPVIEVCSYLRERSHVRARRSMANDASVVRAVRHVEPMDVLYARHYHHVLRGGLGEHERLGPIVGILAAHPALSDGGPHSVHLLSGRHLGVVGHRSRMPHEASANGTSARRAAARYRSLCVSSDARRSLLAEPGN